MLRDFYDRNFGARRGRTSTSRGATTARRSRRRCAKAFGDWREGAPPTDARRRSRARRCSSAHRQSRRPAIVLHGGACSRTRRARSTSDDTDEQPAGRRPCSATKHPRGQGRSYSPDSSISARRQALRIMSAEITAEHSGCGDHRDLQGDLTGCTQRAATRSAGTDSGQRPTARGLFRDLGTPRRTASSASSPSVDLHRLPDDFPHATGSPSIHAPSRRAGDARSRGSTSGTKRVWPWSSPATWRDHRRACAGFRSSQGGRGCRDRSRRHGIRRRARRRRTCRISPAAIRLRTRSRTQRLPGEGLAIRAQLISGCVFEPGRSIRCCPALAREPHVICVPATRDEFFLLHPDRRIDTPADTAADAPIEPAYHFARPASYRRARRGARRRRVRGLCRRGSAGRGRPRRRSASATWASIAIANQRS